MPRPGPGQRWGGRRQYDRPPFKRQTRAETWGPCCFTETHKLKHVVFRPFRVFGLQPKYNDDIIL